MTYSDNLLNKISSFGILGYSVEKIIDLTEPDDPDRFRIDFSTPGTEINKAYRKGKTTGEYNLDKSLFDKATKVHDTVSNTILDNRMDKKRVNDKIFENFNL
ncbi:MAG: hypothetical protein FWF54_03275 [Candidatus Azobacteroides sp.]|nr:hypothetical protein [Candidatus Azobacteroides sp.]